ncbi:hypothetical protein IW261DRAFT_1413565 [Armillaria novae-zelandiae]|uniref:Uncharacterized protein n=1 Tax=Armillaria novae-zelandiae TaxID=153914 RepID=A0AA39PV92_9AGAR|nr:hypothetical protein IW261DRAFT_1413565 [Armillaria novae-zelandiae]
MEIDKPDLPESLSKEFQQLLESNEFPTKTQVMAIQPMLSHAMENMAIIIQAAERFQGVIDDCKVIISPMRRLPPKMLRQIFFWINADRAPLQYDVGPVYSGTMYPVPRNRLRLLEQALALSKRQRLSIRCSLDSDGLLEIEKEIKTIQGQWSIPTESTIATALNHEVLRLLLRESHCWNAVCFRTDDYAYLPVLHDAKGKHSALRVLHTCTPGIFTSLELLNLEEVRLKAASFDETCRFTTLHKLPGLIDRSRDSIRKLILSDVMKSEDLIPVLERPPTLNELHVEQNRWHFDGNEFIARVAKYLRIREDGQISLPKLHTLTISVRGSPK